MGKDSFSKRHGYAGSPREITIWEDAPPRLRYYVLRVLDSLDVKSSASYKVLCEVLQERPDYEIWTKTSLQTLIDHCPLFRVYDFIEAMYAYLLKKEGQ